MTAIALPRPWDIPDWLRGGISAVLGLGLVFIYLSWSSKGIVEVPEPPADLRAFPGCEGFGCDIAIRI